MIPETMEAIRQRQDAEWKMRPFTDDKPLRSAIEIEHSIREHCREGIASHFKLLRQAGIVRLNQVYDRLRGDISHLRRVHSQSIERERREARRAIR